MPNYQATLTRILSASASVGVLYTTSSIALRRLAIYDFTIGVQGTPAGVANLWQLQRFTAPGTSTAVTPTPIDPADPNALISAGQNNTVEPTYSTAVLASKALNQQATYRWFAGQPDQRLLAPATANNGIGVLTPTCGSAGTAGTIEIYYNE